MASKQRFVKISLDFVQCDTPTSHSVTFTVFLFPKKLLNIFLEVVLLHPTFYFYLSEISGYSTQFEKLYRMKNKHILTKQALKCVICQCANGGKYNLLLQENLFSGVIVSYAN